MRLITAILCASVILGATSACGSAEASAPLVPGFLIGTWRTDAQSHRDAFLRLTATTISFGTVEGTIERNTVTSVRRIQDWFGTQYIIEYRDLEGEDYNIGLYFDDQKVRLRNQRQMEWTWSRF